MKSKTIYILAFLLSISTLTASPALSDEAPSLSSGLEALAIDAEFLGKGVFDEVLEVGFQLPLHFAKDVILRSGLTAYVATLPFSNEDVEVKSRILEQVSAKDFVSEILPFLIALKDHYSLSDNLLAETFDNHFREHFSSTEHIPGLEHSMFSWAKDKDKNNSSATSLGRTAVVDILKFYDLLFLKTPRTVLDLEFANDDKVIKEAKALIKPSLKRAVQTYAPDNKEINHTVDEILEDEYRLSALTRTLIDFLRITILKHYQMFARDALISNRLEERIKHLYSRGNDTLLRTYLENANNKRRYAVHIVVDGLQGHLLKALSNGSKDDPFIQEIIKEFDPNHEMHRNRPRIHRKEKLFKNQGQNIQFLKHLASVGYSDPRYLAFFKRIYASDSAGLVNSGVSTTPTISVRNLPIIKTGAPVAGAKATGLPNFHFADRTGVYAEPRAFYFFGNDALLLNEMTHKAGMRTLFERLPLLNTMNCNAYHDRGAGVTLDGLVNLMLGEAIRDFGERLCLSELEERARNEIRLQSLRNKLLKKMDSFHWKFSRSMQWISAGQLIQEIAELEPKGLPQYLLVYNPWPDHFSHYTGPFSDEIISPSGELNRLDYWLNKIENSYRKAGKLERTLFGAAGDHGLANIFYLVSPEEVLFQALENRENNPIKLKRLKISSDEGEGPRLNDRASPKPIKGYDVILASTAGGNYMMDFFIDQESLWSVQPLYHHLTQLNTLAGIKDIDIVEEIRTHLHDSLDYMVVREAQCSPEQAFLRLIATRENQAVHEQIHRIGDKIYYQASKYNLLDVDKVTPYETLNTEQISEYKALQRKCLDLAKKDSVESWCSEKEWRQLASYTKRPGSVDQISHLYDLDYAGTINLFPKAGVGYNTAVPGRHAGEHFHEKDSFLGIWGTPTKKGQPIRTAVIGSVASTIYEYLTGEEITPGRDGWGYESLARSIVKTSP